MAEAMKRIKYQIIAIAVFCALFPLSISTVSANETDLYFDYGELEKDANLYFKLSNALFTAFTSHPSIMQGSFTAKYDHEPDASLDIFKLPIPVYFRKDHSLQPFVKFTYGYSRYARMLPPWDLDFPFEEDFGKQEKLRIITNSFGLRTGLNWEYIPNFSIEPSVGIAYSHIHHKQYSRLMITDLIIERNPDFHRDLFDTTVDIITISPGVKHSLVFHFGPGAVGLDMNFLTQHSRSFRSKGRYADVSSNGSVINVMLHYELPTGLNLLDHDISVKPFVGRTDFFGDIKTGMDMRSMYEYGLHFLVDLERYADFLSRVAFGGSYMKGYQMTSWKIGLGWGF